MDHCVVCGAPLPDGLCDVCGAPVCLEHAEEHTHAEE